MPGNSQFNKAKSQPFKNRLQRFPHGNYFPNPRIFCGMLHYPTLSSYKKKGFSEAPFLNENYTVLRIQVFTKSVNSPN
jgi:hypothetical protein